MFRYVFTIWLATLYSISGAPAVPVGLNATNQSISLSNLANSCENSFLSALIKSKILDCPELEPVTSEKQFQCMLFYDINSRLCAAVASSSLALNEDYTAKIDAQQDLSQLCKDAQQWTTDNSRETYKKSFKIVFEDVIKCAKTCSADYSNILNTDSNFYCRYFKWGTEMLKSQIPTQANLEVASGPISDPIEPKNPAVTDVKTVVSKPELPVGINVPAVGTETKDVLKHGSKPIVPLNIQPQLANDKTHPNVEPPQIVVGVKSTSEKPSSTNKDVAESHIEQPIVDTGVNSEVGVSVENRKDKEEIKDVKGISGISGVGVSGEEQVNNEQPKNSEPEVTKEDQIPSNVDKAASNEKTSKGTDNAKKTEDSPKVVNDQIQLPDDYQSEIDSDEGRGILDAQDGDDGDDLNLREPDQPDLDLTNKETHKKVDSQFANDISQKEYYPNGFAEEDDHFFPFFLTAIIMVVLLYVLYHNKSKVSKLIMGLIVEGRQPGRRRNSRGHAYKRLDTLEQAMSANTAAPPSKIIY